MLFCMGSTEEMLLHRLQPKINQDRLAPPKSASRGKRLVPATGVKASVLPPSIHSAEATVIDPIAACHRPRSARLWLRERAAGRIRIRRSGWERCWNNGALPLPEHPGGNYRVF